MNIAILEDDQKDFLQLLELLKNFFQLEEFKDIPINITRYKSLSSIYDNIYSIDLIFLDIECNKKQNGIDIGIRLRQLKKDLLIIFISHYSEYLIEGYKAQANRYFIKPVKQLTFNTEMKSVLKHFLFTYAGIQDTKLSIKKLYFKDIMYIEFFNRKTHIHHVNGTILDTSYTIKEWVNILPNQYFYQTYRSIIINFMYVCGITNNDIILTNNELIPLARSSKADFNYNYMKYSQWRM